MEQYACAAAGAHPGAVQFGVLALIATPAVFVVLGYLLVSLLGTGFDMRIFFFGIVTHGIVEIPVIVLATASAFKLGSVITKPPRSKPWRAWTGALGDTIKIWFGLVIPGLFLAAAIEGVHHTAHYCRVAWSVAGTLTHGQGSTSS